MDLAASSSGSCPIISSFSLLLPFQFPSLSLVFLALFAVRLSSRRYLKHPPSTVDSYRLDWKGLPPLNPRRRFTYLHSPIAAGFQPPESRHSKATIGGFLQLISRVSLLDRRNNLKTTRPVVKHTFWMKLSMPALPLALCPRAFSQRLA